MSMAFRYILGFTAILMAWCGGYYCGIKGVREERVLFKRIFQKLGIQVKDSK